jgi:hypothetical protein
MKVLLEYCFDHPSARLIYGVVAGSLRLRGNEVELVRTVGRRDLSAYDVFISHDVVDEQARTRPRLGCWGGRALSRPALLEGHYSRSTEASA